MEKYLMKGSKNDLRCDENHQNSIALFLQINSKNEEQNKLLCFQCLEKLNSISNLISVDTLIEKIKTRYEEHFDARKGFLTLAIDQLVEVDNQVELVFKILHENIQEWKNQLQVIINQPIQFDLKQEILLASDQKDLHKTCVDDSISQLQSHFINSITEKLTKLNEIIKLQKIKEIYGKINCEQQQKLDFASFPKSIEQVNEICTGSKSISSVKLNFDNTLLFIGQDYQVVQFSFKSAQQKIIINQNHKPQLAASKIKNLIAVSSENECSLWYCEKRFKWSKIGDYMDNNAISFVYLNQDDTQIIAQTRDNGISIVQINYERKTLLKIQQISNCTTFYLNSLSSKILICQKTCFLVYKQQQGSNQWFLQDKIFLNQKETIISARFIQNDDIIIQCSTEKLGKSIILYVQNQLVRLENKNAAIEIDEKQYLFFPNLFNAQRQLYLQSISKRITFIIRQNDSFFVCEQAIYYNGDLICFSWSSDGKIAVIGETSSCKVKVFQLTYH